jgi:hypothetical protein
MKHVVLIVSISLALAGLGQGDLQADVIPDEYKTAYNEINSILDSYLVANPEKDVKFGNFGCELLAANGNRYKELLNPDTLSGAKFNADKLAELGVEGLTINIAYPLFTKRVANPEKYLQFYKSLVTHIRTKDIKLVLKVHNLFTDSVYGNPDVDYSGITLDKYIAEKRGQIETIIRELKPDFLTFENEPDTTEMITKLKMTPDNFDKVLRAELKDLKHEGILVGAGAGTWSDIEYFKKLADLPMDFVDLHYYPITGDILQKKTDEIINLCNQKNKLVMIGEAWLYKASSEELKRGMHNYIDVYKRDHFDCWAETDQKFTRVMMSLSAKSRAIYTSFFWSNCFFAYIPYEGNSALGEKELIALQNKQVTQSMLSSPPIYSATGQHFREHVNASQQKSTKVIWHGGGRVSWNSANKLVAFDTLQSTGYTTTKTMTPKGNKVTPMTNSFSKHTGNPDWHPSGKWMVYQAQDPKLTSNLAVDKLASPGIGVNNNLWLTDAKGTKHWQITKITDKKGVLHPHFSTDGKKLVWTELIKPIGVGSLGSWAIKICDFAEKNGVPIVSYVKQYTPGSLDLYEIGDVSGDGRKILFAGLPKGKGYFDMEIYQFDVSNNTLTQLTKDNEWDEFPHFAPDGKSIVWVSSSGTNCAKSTTKLQMEFWRMNLDGTGKKRLTFLNDVKSPSYMGKVHVADFCFVDGKTLLSKCKALGEEEAIIVTRLP